MLPALDATGTYQNDNTMRTITIISFLAIVVFSMSCRQDFKKQNTKPTDKCILIEYSESTNCDVLEFYYEVTNRTDSFCGEVPMIIDDFSAYFPSKKVFHVDGYLKPNNLTVMLFWDYNFIKELSSFPFNYSLITIDSLQNDSILCFQLNDEKHYLMTNSTFVDTIVSIRKEPNKKVKYTTVVRIKNLGFILKKNIYDNNNWKEKSKDCDYKPSYVVDVMPEFKGGENALIKYLRKTIIYPEKAKSNGISGKVFVQFFVESSGIINNVNILRGIDPLLDSIALNAIKNMPKWTPGKNNGKDTTVSMVIPINFTIK